MNEPSLARYNAMSRRQRRRVYRLLNRKSPPGVKLNPAWLGAKYELVTDCNPYRLFSR